jgi:hypothetical protein
MSKKKEGFLMFCLLMVLLSIIGYNERTEKENQKALKAQAESASAKKRVNGKLPITRPLASLQILSNNEEGK